MKDFVDGPACAALIGACGAQLRQDEVPCGHVDGGDSRDGLAVLFREECGREAFDAGGGGDVVRKRDGLKGQAAGVRVGRRAASDPVHGPVLNGMAPEVPDDRRVAGLAPAEAAHAVGVSPHIKGGVGVPRGALGLFLYEVGLELESGKPVH